jgi:hypothetical protein
MPWLAVRHPHHTQRPGVYRRCCFPPSDVLSARGCEGGKQEASNTRRDGRRSYFLFRVHFKTPLFASGLGIHRRTVPYRHQHECIHFHFKGRQKWSSISHMLYTLLRSTE